MELTIPVQFKSYQRKRFESYLKNKGFAFTKKKERGGDEYYTIQINKAMDAYWIGANYAAVVNNVIDSCENKNDNARCRVCGCTDNDCSQCIKKTGHPCYWVEENLCSACADN